MGQKVRPTGFRTGIMVDWSSRWYASKQDFAELLVVPDDQTEMPSPRRAKMINLSHCEKLMIAQLKESLPFITGVKLEAEDVLIKRLRLREIVLGLLQRDA